MAVALPGIEIAGIMGVAILYGLVVVLAIVLIPVFKWIGDQIPLVGGWAAGKLIDGVNAVKGDLEHALSFMVHLLVITVAGIAQAVEMYATEAMAAISWTVNGLEHLALAGVAHIVAAMIAGLRHTLLRVEHIATTAYTDVAHLEHRVEVDVRGINDQLIRRIEPELAHLAGPVIGSLEADIRNLEGTIQGVINPELAKLTGQVAGVVATGAALELALSELDPLRCGNVGSLARFLCGLNPDLLALLLAGLSDALVLELLGKAGVSLGDVIGWSGDALGDLEKIVATF